MATLKKYKNFTTLKSSSNKEKVDSVVKKRRIKDYSDFIQILKEQHTIEKNLQKTNDERIS